MDKFNLTVEDIDFIQGLIRNAILDERTRLAEKIYYSNAVYNNKEQIDWDDTVKQLRKDIMKSDEE